MNKDKLPAFRALIEYGLSFISGAELCSFEVHFQVAAGRAFFLHLHKLALPTQKKLTVAPWSSVFVAVRLFCLEKALLFVTISLMFKSVHVTRTKTWRYKPSTRHEYPHTLHTTSSETPGISSMLPQKQY